MIVKIDVRGVPDREKKIESPGQFIQVLDLTPLMIPDPFPEADEIWLNLRVSEQESYYPALEADTLYVDPISDFSSRILPDEVLLEVTDVVSPGLPPVWGDFSVTPEDYVSITQIFVDPIQTPSPIDLYVGVEVYPSFIPAYIGSESSIKILPQSVRRTEENIYLQTQLTTRPSLMISLPNGQNQFYVDWDPNILNIPVGDSVMIEVFGSEVRPPEETHCELPITRNIKVGVFQEIFKSEIPIHRVEGLPSGFNWNRHSIYGMTLSPIDETTINVFLVTGHIVHIKLKTHLLDRVII